MSFDLTREPWLPCFTRDGEPVTLSLADTLLRAHELRELAAVSSPAETAALHRMLLALVYRVAPLEDEPAWEAAWRAGRFDPDRIASYLTRWRSRFDLFATKRPFYQTEEGARLAESSGPQKAPVRRLVFERCNYGVATWLFGQRGEKIDSVSIARAACALVAFQSFANGGLTMGGSDIAAPLVLCGVVLATGATLFETLLLNAVPYVPAKDDCPAWETKEELVPKLIRTSRGWLDTLTWQSRALGLHRDGDRVDAFAYTLGERMKRPAPPDPMGSWKEEEKKEEEEGQKAHSSKKRNGGKKKKTGKLLPVGVSTTRALWRDAHALLQQASGSCRPAACGHIERMAAVIGPDRPLRLDMLGMRWSKKKILIARHERLPLTPSVLADPARLEAVLAAVSRVETVSGFIRSASSQWGRMALGAADEKTIKLALFGPKDSCSGGLCRDAETLFWAALTPPFEHLLLEAEWGEPSRAFELSLEREAMHALTSAIRARSGTSARSLRAAAAAERLLLSRLRRTPETEEFAS